MMKLVIVLNICIIVSSITFWTYSINQIREILESSHLDKYTAMGRPIVFGYRKSNPSLIRFVFVKNYRQGLDRENEKLRRPLIIAHMSFLVSLSCGVFMVGMLFLGYLSPSLE